jgi:hypothetical protein
MKQQARNAVRYHVIAFADFVSPNESRAMNAR